MDPALPSVDPLLVTRLERIISPALQLDLSTPIRPANMRPIAPDLVMPAPITHQQPTPINLYSCKPFIREDSGSQGLAGGRGVLHKSVLSGAM